MPSLSPQPERDVNSRVPRERGARVRVGEREFTAASVRDLYEQVLKFLVSKHESAMTKLLPYRTSPRRYLVAQSATHPGGNPFVMPIEYHGYHMETHKDYKNGIAHLRQFLKRLGLDLQYLG